MISRRPAFRKSGLNSGTRDFRRPASRKSGFVSGPRFQTSSGQKIWTCFWARDFKRSAPRKSGLEFWARDFKGVAFRSSGLDCGGQKSNTSSGSRNQSQKLINISWLCDSAKVVLVQLEYCTGKSHTILHRERESESTVMMPKVPIH